MPHVGSTRPDPADRPATTLGVSAVGLGIATLMFSGVQPNITDGTLDTWAVDRFLGLAHLTWIAFGCVGRVALKLFGSAAG